MADHDQRFKEVIREFFPDFLRLFFADYAARLDLDRVEWLQQEVFPEPPEGSRHLLDLVAKVPALEPVGAAAHRLALVHIEIESADKATLIRARLARTARYLSDRKGLPVLPVVLFLNVGLAGIGIDEYVESFFELEVFRFRYLYVGLKALDAVEYVTGENPIGVALTALMNVPHDRAVWCITEALRKLADVPVTDQQRYLLMSTINAYQRLDAAQTNEYERVIAAEPFARVRALNQTYFDQGLLIGEQKALLRVLDARFGPLNPAVRERVKQLPVERVEELLVEQIEATSLEELGLAD